MDQRESQSFGQILCSLPRTPLGCRSFLQHRKLVFIQHVSMYHLNQYSMSTRENSRSNVGFHILLGSKTCRLELYFASLIAWGQCVTLEAPGRTNRRHANQYLPHSQPNLQLQNPFYCFELNQQTILALSQFNQDCFCLNAGNRRILYNDQFRRILILPEKFADVWIRGHPLELMDGDNSYIPFEWFSAVIRHTTKKLTEQLKREPKIAVVPILGIQSSGKSTFLNILFGLSFKVAQIRCTKGIFLQILYVEPNTKKELDIEFDLVIVCDTEGLRAEELKLQQHSDAQGNRHDNKMGTLVLAIGDLTLINCIGLQTDQITEVLQIVTYALIQSDRPNVRPASVFVHQNIKEGDGVKKDNTNTQQQICNNFDAITQVAARKVGKSKRFNQWSDVIKPGQTDQFVYIHPIGYSSLSAGYLKDCRKFKNNTVLKALNQLMKEQHRNQATDNAPVPMTFQSLEEKVRNLRDDLETLDYVLNFKHEMDMLSNKKVEEAFSKLKRSFDGKMDKLFRDSEEKARENPIKNEKDKKEVENHLLLGQERIDKYSLEQRREFEKIIDEDIASSKQMDEFISDYKKKRLIDVDQMVKERCDTYNFDIEGSIKDQMLTNSEFREQKIAQIESTLKTLLRQESSKYQQQSSSEIAKAFDERWPKLFSQHAAVLHEDQQSADAKQLMKSIHHINTQENSQKDSYNKVKCGQVTNSKGEQKDFWESISKDFSAQYYDFPEHSQEYPDINWQGDRSESNSKMNYFNPFNYFASNKSRKGVGVDDKTKFRQIHQSLIQEIDTYTSEITINNARYHENIYEKLVQRIVSVKEQKEKDVLGNSGNVSFTDYYMAKLKLVARDKAYPELVELIQRQKKDNPYDKLQRELQPRMLTLWKDMCNQIQETKKDFNQMIEILSTEIIEDLRNKRQSWIDSQVPLVFAKKKESIIASMMTDLLEKSGDEFIEFTQQYSNFCKKWVHQQIKAKVWPDHALQQGRDQLNCQLTKYEKKFYAASESNTPILQWLKNQNVRWDIIDKIVRALGEGKCSKLESGLLYKEFVENRNSLKKSCKEKFESNIVNCEDIDAIIQKSASQFMNRNLGCTEQCPCCGAICQHSTKSHTGLHQTKFHTCEAYRANSVWKDEAWFVTCYYQIQVGWPFYTYQEGEKVQWNYKEYKKAGKPYPDWDIDVGQQQAQLLFYDYMSIKYMDKILKQMNNIPAVGIEFLKNPTKEEVITELNQYNANQQ